MSSMDTSIEQPLLKMDMGSSQKQKDISIVRRPWIRFRTIIVTSQLRALQGAYWGPSQQLKAD